MVTIIYAYIFFGIHDLLLLFYRNSIWKLVYFHRCQVRGEGGGGDCGN